MLSGAVIFFQTNLGINDDLTQFWSI